MAPLRVLLADDHELVRAGISSLLQRIPELTVVAEAANGHEALRLITQHCPDVVLLDISMPELNGLEVAERLAHESPAVRVIILSMHATSDYVLRAMRAGASGYLLKGARLAELELAVSAVARGETYLSPAAAKHVIGGYRDRASGLAPAAEAGPERLTARQPWRAESVEGFLDELYRGKALVAQRPHEFVRLFAFQVGVLALDVLTLYSAFRALGHDPHLSVVILSYSLATLFATIAPLPGGGGSFEATVALSATRLGVTAEVALGATLIYRVLTFWLPALLSVATYRTLLGGTPARAAAQRQDTNSTH